MGDLGVDTAVEQVDEGRFTAKLSDDWAIWGPMGGYIASFALRAAGAASPFDRPASFFCQYLGVAAFDTIDIEVTTLRQAKTALAQRVQITQAGRLMLEATVWSTGDVEGLDHDETRPPEVPDPGDLKPISELLSPEDLKTGPPFPFWNNFETRPVTFRKEWPPTEPLPALYRDWQCFVPASTFDDPWVDACRSLILVDVQSWPAASRPHAWKDHGMYAPSLDLYVSFNDPQPQSGWLLTDGEGPLAAHGLMAWNGRLWSEDRKLVASGMGQLLCRRMPGR
jgi:acyl-CoA thioesterase-2